MAGVPAEQHLILTRIGVPVGVGPQLATSPDLVVDALLGYSLDGSPRGLAAELIGALPDTPTIALDVPSGLELATGTLHEIHVRAMATLTLAAPKLGLDVPAAGDLFLADISVPAAAFEALGVQYRAPFGPGPVVALA